jgi:hypothetical protein
MATKKAPASKKAATVKKAPTRKRITEASIRKRAQEIYLKRMEEGLPGDADSDWRQAEKELRNQ